MTGLNLLFLKPIASSQQIRAILSFYRVTEIRLTESANIEETSSFGIQCSIFIIQFLCSLCLCAFVTLLLLYLSYLRGIFMILLIDNYDSFVYNLAQYIGELKYKLDIRRNDEIFTQT